MTYITLWLVPFLILSFHIFLHFNSCDSHFGTCYPSALFWQQSGLSFTSSPVAIYPIWIAQCCSPISCSFSKVFRCGVYTVYFKEPSSYKIDIVFYHPMRNHHLLIHMLSFFDLSIVSILTYFIFITLSLVLSLSSLDSTSYQYICYDLEQSSNW